MPVFVLILTVVHAVDASGIESPNGTKIAPMSKSIDHHLKDDSIYKNRHQ